MVTTTLPGILLQCFCICPRANMDCQANMLGIEVAVAMFYTFYHMFMCISLRHAI